jgi:hypothetical protein
VEHWHMQHIIGNRRTVMSDARLKTVGHYLFERIKATIIRSRSIERHCQAFRWMILESLEVNWKRSTERNLGPRIWMRVTEIGRL